MSGARLPARQESTSGPDIHKPSKKPLQNKVKKAPKLR